MNFIVKTVKTFNISPEHTRVALISYANKAYLKFGFEDYTDSQGLLRGLYAIKSDHLNTSSRVSFIPAYKTTLIAFYEKRLQASQALVLLTYASNFTQNSQMENLVNNIKSQKISISVVVMDTKAELSNLAVWQDMSIMYTLEIWSQFPGLRTSFAKVGRHYIPLISRE